MELLLPGTGIHKKHMQAEEALMRVFKIHYVVLMLSVCTAVASCGKAGDTGRTAEVTITLGAYTVPKEAYQKEIIPAFQQYWKDKTGQTVMFAESYEASGAQARAIQAGLEADVAALSLEQDVEALRTAGLITHDWRKARGGGFVTRSVVVIAYRPGNPKNIKDFEDLRRDDVDVIYPNPRTSGGAMWVVNAIYGAGLKLSEARTGTPDKGYARELLKAIQKRVKVMDQSGRLSVTTFENGIGDALLTYENEALLRQKQGKDFPFVIPQATILIENPVALVDKHVDKHNNRAVVEAFVAFLYTEMAQRAYAGYGFRPIDPVLAQELQDKFPLPEYLFDSRLLGGWEGISHELYGPQGVWAGIIEELGRER